VFSTDYRKKTTDEDKGRVQILVILFRVIAVKLSGFSAVYSEEVGPRVICPHRVKELFEGGAEALLGYQRRRPGCTVMEWVVRTTLDLSGRRLGLAVPAFHGGPPSERASSSVVIVGGG